MSYFMVLFSPSPRESEEAHKIPRSGEPVTGPRFEREIRMYKRRTSVLQLLAG